MVDQNDFFVSDQELGVCCLHLVSGEDIIGRVVQQNDENTSKYIVKKPAIPNITAGQNTEGQPSFRVGLLPLRPYMGNVPEIELPVAYVMYLVKVNPQMEKLYVEFTSSIILAPAGSVPPLVRG